MFCTSHHPFHTALLRPPSLPTPETWSKCMLSPPPQYLVNPTPAPNELVLPIIRQKKHRTFDHTFGVIFLFLLKLIVSVPLAYLRLPLHHFTSHFPDKDSPCFAQRPFQTCRAIRLIQVDSLSSDGRKSTSPCLQKPVRLGRSNISICVVSSQA